MERGRNIFASCDWSVDKGIQSAHPAEIGGNAVIDAGDGNTITLPGIAAGDLRAGDVLFA